MSTNINQTVPIWAKVVQVAKGGHSQGLKDTRVNVSWQQTSLMLLFSAVQVVLFLNKGNMWPV